MPGAYAHMSIVNDAQKHIDGAGLRGETAAALGRHLKYVELGSVSPDYPYPALKQANWADIMHYLNTSTLLRTGVAAVRALAPSDRPRAIAWLFGFAAHMTSDMTIHPVVELKVGAYGSNKGEHRRCEMHQDAFIFPRIVNVGEAGLSDHLATGIASCHAPDDKDSLLDCVQSTWITMLTGAYPDAVAQNLPDPSVWHRGFSGVLKTMGSANRLFPFARHVASNLNIAYPKTAEVLDTYIFGLATPEGPMDYLQIFERARTNVVTVWAGLDAALRDGDSQFLKTLQDWDLDTGRNLVNHNHVFWGAKQ